MTMTVLLRLASRALASGRLAGEAEVVETGERRVVRNADDLVEFLHRADGDSEAGEPAGEGGER